MNVQKSETRIVLIGCGAMAIETAQYIVAQSDQLGITDSSLVVTDVVSTDSKRLDQLQQVLGYKVECHRHLSDVANISTKRFVIAIGSVNAIYSISAQIREISGKYFTVIHPTAEVSEYAEIREGCIIAPFAFVGPFAKVGANSIINVGATIGHDVDLGRGVIVSPKADVNGGASCADFAFLGAGVTIDPRVSVGRFAKISSGTVVSSSVEAGMLVFHRHQTKFVKMFDPDNGTGRFKR